jgi:hypothetical protein
MASPEENMAAAQQRAADNRKLAEEARGRGDLDKADMYNQRATTWDASADRYSRIIDAKQRIDTAKKNIEAIQKRVDDIKKSSDSTTVTSSRQVGQYAEVTSVPDASCPGGHRRVQIHYLNGKEISRDDLGCLGGSKKSSDENNASAQPTPSTTPYSPPKPPPPPPPPVKTAPIDTVLFEDDSLPVETMFDLIFEDIGGQELINIARNDTIIGQNIVYNPIKNATALYQEYNPNNIVALQSTSDKYFANYPIKLETKIPSIGNGENGVNYYIDPNTGDLIIETINMFPDEQIEVQITLSGTIYEVTI